MDYIYDKDDRIALFLPCSITIHNKDSGSLIRLAKPTALAGFFPDSGLAQLGQDVQDILIEAINEATKN